MDIHIEYTPSHASAPVTATPRLAIGIPLSDTPNHHIMALPSKSASGLAIAVSPMGASIAYHPPLLRTWFSGRSPIKSAVIPQKISLANSLARAHGGHGRTQGEEFHTEGAEFCCPSGQLHGGHGGKKSPLTAVFLNSLFHGTFNSLIKINQFLV